MTTAAAPLVLIEPAAGSIGGHWFQAAIRLARQCTAEGRVCMVVAPGGIEPTARAALHRAGAHVLGRVGREPTERALWAASRLLDRASRLTGRLARHRRLPHQIGALARCLAEAAALRAGTRRVWTDRPVVVVLSASGALHGLAAALSRTAHIRVVHEVPTTEDRVLRLIGQLASANLHQVRVVCPTKAVRARLAHLFPGLPVGVWPFALADAEPRLSDAERTAARADFGLQPDDTALALVGGWWPHKDIPTVAAALARLPRPVCVLVAGHPLDPVLLRGLAAAADGRVHALPGPAPRWHIRRVYAAADAAIVARRAGVGKESGLIADCTVLGVPLLVSDHDPAITDLLGNRPWVRLFRTANPAALAAAITDLARRPLPRPAPGEAAHLGLPTAATTLAFWTDLATDLGRNQHHADPAADRRHRAG
ncbi:glycosyltransferase family protein [Plantactinospora soyae]|uniref:Glycosyltransferase involved in cell wall biosynthesis n=1 Tax=Plantactinospora soyae TaxID=1544732 RepID=A0A927M1C1_9ACTN|nr:glycosyltransferase family 1 protein [Plantactinospora soyae]MBE1484992.1 glycosyltransferase involved in cell wall biosynthesis [Plantactinospora soyae]